MEITLTNIDMDDVDHAQKEDHVDSKWTIRHPMNDRHMKRLRRNGNTEVEVTSAFSQVNAPDRTYTEVHTRHTVPLPDYLALPPKHLRKAFPAEARKEGSASSEETPQQHATKARFREETTWHYCRMALAKMCKHQRFLHVFDLMMASDDTNLPDFESISPLSPEDAAKQEKEATSYLFLMLNIGHKYVKGREDISRDANRRTIFSILLQTGLSSEHMPLPLKHAYRRHAPITTKLQHVTKWAQQGTSTAALIPGVANNPTASLHKIEIASPTGKHAFLIDLQSADASTRNLTEERKSTKQYRTIGQIIDGAAPISLLTDDKWTTFGAGTNDST